MSVNRIAEYGRLNSSAIGILLAMAGTIREVFMGSIVGSGDSAKTLGCPSCHNPSMGTRQALPPSNVGEYYRTNCQQQVDAGRYNIGSEGHGGAEGGSYKDANWQLKHFYEPTMTW